MIACRANQFTSARRTIHGPGEQAHSIVFGSSATSTSLIGQLPSSLGNDQQPRGPGANEAVASRRACPLPHGKRHRLRNLGSCQGNDRLVGDIQEVEDRRIRGSMFRVYKLMPYVETMGKAKLLVRIELKHRITGVLKPDQRLSDRHPIG
jgi:hypothetical protein